jgi:hypothetical protein
VFGAPRRSTCAALTAAAIAVSVLAVGSADAAPVAVAPVPGQVGNDISWPQCPVAQGGFGLPAPRPQAQFVVIGLTRGAGFTRNPCLADQVAQAVARGLPAQGYLVPTYPTTAQLSASGAAGPWASTTAAGRLLNAGYAEAADALAGAAAVSFQPPMVWVDVEKRKTSPWPAGSAPATTGNRLVVLGALRRLDEAGVRAGVYSTSSHWAEITGGWRAPRLPVWATAGPSDQAGAQARCAGAGWGGGPVHLAQWWDPVPHPSYDDDVTCPAFAFRPARSRPPSAPFDTGNDVDGNWASDLVARQSSTGSLWLYPRDAATGAWRRRVQLGTGWGRYDTVLTPGDLDRDGAPDVVARRGGDLWLFPARVSGSLGRGVKLGSGWGAFDTVIGPGDLTGDDVPDLLARKRSTGALWLFPRTAPVYGKAGWGKPRRVATGWRGLSLLTGAGDLTGDGRADLLARTSTGILQLYPGTGSASAPFAKKIVLGTGWQTFDALVGPGDVDRDGRPDLLARKHATGALMLFSRREDGSWRRPVKVSDGWRGFDAIS